MSCSEKRDAEGTSVVRAGGATKSGHAARRVLKWFGASTAAAIILLMAGALLARQKEPILSPREATLALRAAVVAYIENPGPDTQAGLLRARQAEQNAVAVSQSRTQQAFHRAPKDEQAESWDACALQYVDAVQGVEYVSREKDVPAILPLMSMADQCVVQLSGQTPPPLTVDDLSRLKDLAQQNRLTQVRQSCVAYLSGLADKFGNTDYDAMEIAATVPDLVRNFGCDTGTADDRAYHEQALQQTLALAEKSYPQAMVFVARVYEEGLGGLPQDAQVAGEWYRRSAATGVEDSWLHYRQLYNKGLYRPESKQEAASQRVFENALHAFNLQQYSASLKSFQQASDLGCTWGALYAGYQYSKSLGMTRPDYKEAFNWYELCWKQGNLHCGDNYQGLQRDLLIAENRKRWPPDGCAPTYKAAGCSGNGMTTYPAPGALEQCYMAKFPGCALPDPGSW
jgi:hypothetical protein